MPVLIDAETIAFVATFVVAIAMCTLGSVLLVFFLFKKSTSDRRIFLAGLIGPSWVLLPLLLVFIVSEGGSFNVIWASSTIVGGCLLIIGWPVAHFATRKLDKLTQFKPSVFE